MVPDESIVISLLDGSTLEMSAPEGVLAAGWSTHTLVSHRRLVIVAETARKNFGAAIFAEMVAPQEEPYRGGDPGLRRMERRAVCTVWIGD